MTEDTQLGEGGQQTASAGMFASLGAITTGLSIILAALNVQAMIVLGTFVLGVILMSIPIAARKYWLGESNEQ